MNSEKFAELHMKK